jgi:hypothetical protein
MPITSDGKAPNLSWCSQVIREVAGKAVRRALRAEPPEPRHRRSQKEVVLAHLDAAIAKPPRGRGRPRQRLGESTAAAVPPRALQF